MLLCVHLLHFSFRLHFRVAYLLRCAQPQLIALVLWQV